MLRVIFAFGRDETAATAIEYSLLAALIAIGAIAAFSVLGNGITAIFGSTQTGAGSKIEAAAGQV